MTVMSWLRFTVCLWLLRKAVKAAGWLLLAAAGRRAVAGHRRDGGRVPRRVAARLAAGPAAPRRRRVPAGHRRLRGRGMRCASTAGGPPRWLPARDWAHGWHRPTALAVARMFVLAAPAAIPAGLALAAALWAWRNYAHQRRDRRADGLRPGHLRRPPVATAGPRRHRPHRRARLRPAADPGRDASRSAAPSARSACRWQPVFTLPAAACARHMVIIGATGSGKTNLMIRLWAGWFTAALDAHYAGTGGPAAADRAGLQGRPGRPPQGRPDPPPALRRRRPPRRDLAR